MVVFGLHIRELKTSLTARPQYYSLMLSHLKGQVEELTWGKATQNGYLITKTPWTQ